MSFIININEAGTITTVDEAPGNLTWPLAKAEGIARLNQKADDWWTYEVRDHGDGTASIAVLDENDEYLGDL